MKIISFSTQDFEQAALDRANAENAHDIVYRRERLYQATATMAKGFPAVSTSGADSVDAQTIQTLAAGGTRLVLQRAAGYDNIDLDAAQRAGITVMRVPAYAPAAIAEHAVALMLALNRHICRAYDRIRQENFSLKGLMGFNMFGKTVGIVGTGTIGTELARIMKGFGCRLLGYDVATNPRCTELGLTYVDLPALLATSDIVSLHCPLTPQTKHLINAATLALMKPDAMLINTSRGAVVDAAAVVGALKERRLGYFGMDVYEGEGALFYVDRSESIITDDVFERLLTFPNVVVTGHQAWFTAEALNAIATTTLANATSFEAGHPDPHAVIRAPERESVGSR